jgi:hypothetical protein
LLPVLASRTHANIISQTQGEVEFTTKLHPSYPIIPPDETSVGFFYRLERTNPTGTKSSYFWSGSILDKNPDALEVNTETFNFPDGQYDLTAYELRKGGPIKTGYASFTINGSNNMSPFPIIFLGGAKLGLFSSWNIFTKVYPNTMTPNPEHYTPTVSYIPDEDTPWVIMTLVKNPWKGTPITLSYPSYLTFVDAIFENCMIGQGNCSPSLDFQQSTYLGIEKLNIYYTGSTSFDQAIIHLIFKKTPGYIPPDPKNVTFEATFDSDTATIPDSTTTEFGFEIKASAPRSQPPGSR